MTSFVRPLSGLAARPVTLIALLIALLLWGGTAQAGLGSLTKAAKDKATKEVAKTTSPATPGAAPKFDETTLELTPGMLDKLIACRKAANDATKDRAKLVERSNQIQKELDDLRSKNGDAIIASENKRSEVENCRTSAFEDLKNRKMQEAILHMQGNQNLIQKMSDLALQMSQAQAAHDSAKIARANDEMCRAIGIGHADTLAIDAKCGVVPPVHPAKARIEALDKEWHDTMAKIRTMDEQALEIQKKQCGMSAEQLGVAWDRIQDFLGGRGTFSDTERKALTERKDVLQPLAL